MRLSGIAITAGLAGCQTTTGGDDDERDTTTRDAGGGSGATTTENRDAEIEFVDTDAVTTLSIVRPDTIDDVARVELEISDADGLQDVEVTYTDDYRDNPLLVADETGIEGDTESGNRTIQLTGEFPRRVVAPSTGEFTVEVTDKTGNTQTRTEPIKTQTRGWVVDREDGQYQTKRTWDDLAFDREQFYTDYVSAWHDQAVYSTVLRELQNNNQEKYDGDPESRFYSNSEYRIGNAGEFGHWDKAFYEELTQLKNILEDAQSAIHTHQSDVHPTAYSAWNNRFAATLEDIVHTFNAEAREHLEETGRKAVHAGWVDEVEHGTVITYTDLENTDIEAEYPWQFVDTTADTIAPVTREINTGGNYNPFVEGYGSESGMGYRAEKEKSIAGLRNFVTHDKSNGEDLDPKTIDISDDILQHAFNDHIPSKGSIKPILDMMESAIHLQIDTGNYVHVYGEDLENYGMAVTKDEALYEKSMTRGTQVTADVVETYLTDSPN